MGSATSPNLSQPPVISRNPSRTIIGLTGSFGSGKSTVAGLFQELGAAIVDADKITHELFEPGHPEFKKIAALFKGKQVLSQTLDRKKIAEIVFRDAALRKKLEAIVHPYVFSRMVEEITDAEEPVVVLEIPLLFETGFHQYCKYTVVVAVSEAQAARRLKERGFSAQEVKKRWAAQLPLSEKMKLADFIVDNSGEFKKTKDEVKKIWKKITSPTSSSTPGMLHTGCGGGGEDIRIKRRKTKHGKRKNSHAPKN
ncbi:MAG: dephospho-CoA kinase [Candidatus Omnitrophica bacterium]|nr:dephospho-CoA kinase [Candidatus Omnitrophota bacterium]